MGRCIVQRFRGEGAFTAQTQHDNERVVARIAQITELIENIEDEQLPAARKKRDEAVAKLQAEQNKLENDFGLASQRTLAEILEFETALLKLQLEADLAATEFRVLLAQIKALEAEQFRLERETPDVEPVNCWCCDYTRTLPHEEPVGEIEIPGERKTIPILIQPGYRDNARIVDQRDGDLQYNANLSPEGWYWNLAMLPGWQKFRPTYRLGTIVRLEGDICDVVLDEALSSQQLIDINAELNLLEVPITYMNCNGEAFEVNDRVVVKFADQQPDTPRVIGFESHPRPCPGAIHAMPIDDQNALGFGRELLPYEDGYLEPDHEDYPATTEPDSWILDLADAEDPEGGPWVQFAPYDYQYGNVDWRGNISHDGPTSMYWFAYIAPVPSPIYPGQRWGTSRRSFDGTETLPAVSTNIYRYGQVWATAPDAVLGAAEAIANDEDKTKWVICVCADTPTAPGSGLRARNHTVYAAPSSTMAAPEWQALATINFPDFLTDFRHVWGQVDDWLTGSALNPWRFSDSATKAASIQYVHDPSIDTDEQPFVATLFMLSISFEGGSPIAEITTVSKSSVDHSEDGDVTLTDLVTSNQQAIFENPIFGTITITEDPPRTGYSQFNGAATFSHSYSELLAVDYEGEQLVGLLVEETFSGTAECSGSATLMSQNYIHDGDAYTWSEWGNASMSGSESSSHTRRLLLVELSDEGGGEVARTIIKDDVTPASKSYSIVNAGSSIILDSAHFEEVYTTVTGLPRVLGGRGNETAVYSGRIDVPEQFSTFRIITADLRKRLVMLDLVAFDTTTEVVNTVPWFFGGEAPPDEYIPQADAWTAYYFHNAGPGIGGGRLSYHQLLAEANPIRQQIVISRNGNPVVPSEPITARQYTYQASTTDVDAGRWNFRTLVGQPIFYDSAYFCFGAETQPQTDLDPVINAHSSNASRVEDWFFGAGNSGDLQVQKVHSYYNERIIFSMRYTTNLIGAADFETDTFSVFNGQIESDDPSDSYQADKSLRPFYASLGI